MTDDKNKYILSINGMSKSFGRNKVLKHISMNVKPGTIMGLMGENGAGKSTLMKILAGLEPPTTGTRDLGTNVGVAYYAQHALEGMTESNTVLQEIDTVTPKWTVPQQRSLLGAFLFSDNDAIEKQVRVLSGGEKARLALAKMLVAPEALLCLDEPTNHLDIASKEILEEALNSYTGTVFYVSHDRYFINQTATRILDLTNQAIVNYIGDYDYYLEKKEELTAAYSNASRLENNSSSAAFDLASDSKLSWQEQKEAQAKERKRANEFKKTEERIGVLEDRSAEIDILMSQEEVYTNSVKCQELAKERAEIDAELETLYEKWEELAE